MCHNAATRFRCAAAMLALCLAVLMGCAQRSAVKPTTETEESAEPKMITGLRTTEDADTAAVVIESNQELVYTSVKQETPAGVILYFPDTALFLNRVESDSIAGSGVIESVETSEMTEKGTAARIEILLKKDLPYEVDPVPGGLQIAFAKPSAEEASEGKARDLSKAKGGLPELVTAKPATELESVTTVALENGQQVDINANGAILDYQGFTVANPARIVFDIFGIKADTKKEEQQEVGTRWVRRVRYFGYPDKVRVVLDTRPAYLDRFQAVSTNSGLSVVVGESGGTMPSAAKAAPTPEAETAAAAPAPAQGGKPAWVNRVDFSSEQSGSSTVIIGTTAPVRYDIEKTAERRLLFRLYNTRLPSYQQRPLITTRFSSAVDRISPVQPPDAQDLTLIAIELRESVPYDVEQVEDLLMVHFEPSAIPPKPYEQAQLPEWKRVLTESAAEAVPGPMTDMPPVSTEAPAATELEPMPEAAGPEPAAAIAATPSPFSREEKRYTGEKIALDFYDTDIKNVFRILREISGQNFAIDQNVTGKVTLTIDKPVPWDQVLDLVLRMNQLGMVQEGNINRIATLETLAEEEELRRGQLEARLRAQEQQEALEPLVTEYIPISYANAESDIRPHLESLLTKGRGSISVDSRTNLIIFTDIPSKVEQAKEVVKKLDTVTPQVLIEARIVEANTDFARNFGVDWDMQIGPQASSNLGGDIQYDFATNNLGLTTNTGVLGIAFNKIGGTPMTLNAQLQALESTGEGKIISTPKIVTLDNKAATIKQGTEFPYNKLDADGNTTTEFLDIVLQLTVTPHVTPDDRISMNLQITKSDQLGFAGNIPVLATKDAQTELLVNDGETFVIAGIIQNTVNEGQDGVPGLMQVPLLGWFFKSKSLSQNKNELLIFITPKIIRLEQRNFS